jgi:hypothetical protein
LTKFYRWKIVAKNWVSSVNKKNLLNLNNGPIGENSPNLVTLHVIGSSRITLVQIKPSGPKSSEADF